jgi:hypothetical protein
MVTSLRSSKQNEGFNELDIVSWSLFGDDILSDFTMQDNSSDVATQSRTDDSGNLAGYTHITTSTDANGNTYSWTHHYDAHWNLTESAYTDSAGNTSLTQYQSRTDDTGNLAGNACIDLCVQSFGALSDSDDPSPVSSTLAAALSELAFSEGAREFSYGSEDLTENVSTTDINVNLVGICNVVHNDFFIT